MLKIIRATFDSTRLHFFTSGFALKDFSLNTERKFTKTISNNIQLRWRTSYSAKIFLERKEFEKNDVHTCTIVQADCHNSHHSPAICEQN